MPEDTVSISTVEWRESVGKTLAKIDTRTALMAQAQKDFVTMPQVEEKIKEANTEQLEEHVKLCGLQRENDRLKGKKSTPSVPPGPRMRGTDFFKNLTIPQTIKYAVFIGFLVGTFVAGLQF
jgi:hypothetical protein